MRNKAKKPKLNAKAKSITSQVGQQTKGSDWTNFSSKLKSTRHMFPVIDNSDLLYFTPLCNISRFTFHMSCLYRFKLFENSFIRKSVVWGMSTYQWLFFRIYLSFPTLGLRLIFSFLFLFIYFGHLK